jgi:hypothetical protein|tara:strand:+ start:5680 stop:5922 length:243 start_codon:yes stop_codon:yes gene_type:complete
VSAAQGLREIDMKHAKRLAFSDTFVGMQFLYASWTLADGSCDAVGTVTERRLTKSGRVALTVDGKKWTNAPHSPASPLQE